MKFSKFLINKEKFLKQKTIKLNKDSIFFENINSKNQLNNENISFQTYPNFLSQKKEID